MSKLDGDYTLQDVLTIMSDGNIGALSFLLEVLNLQDEDRFIKYIEFFNDNEIYGSKLYMFWNDSCDRNLELVDWTINMLKSNGVSKEIIHRNLDRGRALPFKEHLKEYFDNLGEFMKEDYR